MDEDDINRLRIALGRISRQVDRHVAGDGMSRTQLGLLATLARSESLGMSELADAEGLNPTMASRIVGKLELAGLVRRAQDPDDRRAVLVQITAAGSRLQRRLRRQRTALFLDRMQGLPAAQRRALLAAVPALEGLAEAMRVPPPSTGSGTSGPPAPSRSTSATAPTRRTQAAMSL